MQKNIHYAKKVFISSYALCSDADRMNICENLKFYEEIKSEVLAGSVGTNELSLSHNLGFLNP